MSTTHAAFAMAEDAKFLIAYAEGLLDMSSSLAACLAMHFSDTGLRPCDDFPR